MQAMIGYNDYENDPLSHNDPCQAIACRRDLSPGKSSYPAGAIDGKVSSAVTIQQSMANNQATPMLYARMGPTHDDVIPFCWSNQEGVYMHNGQSDCFNYNWIAFPL